MLNFFDALGYRYTAKFAVKVTNPDEQLYNPVLTPRPICFALTPPRPVAAFAPEAPEMVWYIISLKVTPDEKSGVKKADEKGIQESLVMMDSLAFIVNIPNKTVVTAMDQRETEENVFTNIDGAVII